MSLHDFFRAAGAGGQRLGHCAVQLPVGDFVGPEAAQDGMPVMLSGEAYDFREGVSDGCEHAIHVRRVATTRARAARFPEQFREFRLQVNQIVPGDTVDSFQLGKIRKSLHNRIYPFRVWFNLAIAQMRLNVQWRRCQQSNRRAKEADLNGITQCAKTKSRQ